MRKALIIGSDDYPTAPLTRCVNDALEMGDLLATNEDGTGNFITTVLTDRLTKSKLRESLNNLFRYNSDIALFYYSGHGANDYLGHHIMTYDSTPNDMGVPMSQVLSVVNSSNARNKIVILDCCYAGGLGEFGEASGMSVYLRNGITIMASSRATEKSKEGEKHSIFTNLLIEALKGGAADLYGNITPGSIYAFIDKALGPSEQRPVFKTNISEFVSLRKVKPPLAVEVLQNLPVFFAGPESVYPLDPSYEDTNDPAVVHVLAEPYADPVNVIKFKQLQKLQGVGLVEPVDEPFMFFAAMRSAGCRLTALGRHYWHLANKL